MKSMLQHLCHALHFGDPAWPHTESQAQLAIHYLEVTATSFVWGQKHDDSIVACFLDEGGLSIFEGQEIGTLCSFAMALANLFVLSTFCLLGEMKHHVTVRRKFMFPMFHS